MFHALESCARGCTVEVLRTASARTWRVRIKAPTWDRCFLVDFNTFGYDEQHGMSGSGHRPADRRATAAIVVDRLMHCYPAKARSPSGGGRFVMQIISIGDTWLAIFRLRHA
jgi:hypothetical protein